MTTSIKEEARRLVDQLPDDATWDDLMREIAAQRVDDAERQRRQEVVQAIDALRHRLYVQYGEMPDSTALLREDRNR
jgi:hypothetical protein